MSNYDLLFGKALQTIVTRTLLNKNNAGIDNITILELSNQILSDRPILKSHLKSYSDKKKFRQRVFNCVKQLNKAELIQIEKISAKKIGQEYYIIYTKIK